MTAAGAGSRERTRALAALFLLTTVWGSTFVVLQRSLASASPFVLIALRFALAAAGLFALRPRAGRGALRLVGAALPLTLSMFLGFALQTHGLAHTTPARSSFLTALSVVFVPLFEWFDTRRFPRPSLVAAVVLAALGVQALFYPFRLEWNLGDTLTLLGAVAFAFYVVELGRMSRRHDTTALAGAQFVGMAGLAAILAAVAEVPRFEATPAALLAFAYLAVVCTAATFWLMTWAQARVGNVEAGVIYTLEPVFASALSVAAGADRVDLNLLLGGMLIVAGTLVAAGGPHESPPAPATGQPAAP